MLRLVSNLCKIWKDHADCSGWTSGTLKRAQNKLRRCHCPCHAKRTATR